MRDSNAGASREPSKAPRTCVLLVEDDKWLRYLLAAALKHGGYEVVEAEGVVQALRYMADCFSRPTGWPDVVVSEIEMNGFNGMDLLARLRGSDWGLPVVLLAPRGEGETVAGARKLGAAMVLEKPIDVGKFAAAVSRVVPAR